MSWLVFLVLAGVPALLYADLPGLSARGGCARWWRGRALACTVVHFCLALAAAALMVGALDAHAR